MVLCPLFMLKGLLEAHDNIAEQYLSKNGPGEDSHIEGEEKKKAIDKSNMSLDSTDSNVRYDQPIRIISLRKSPTQPLVRTKISFI